MGLLSVLARSRRPAPPLRPDLQPDSELR